MTAANTNPPGAKLYWKTVPPLPEQDLSDQDLARAVLSKDRKATAEFVSRFSDSLYGFLCQRLLPREDVVEDLFQEVFLDAWRHLPKWRGEGALRSWLLGIARHKVQDYYRGRLREADWDGGDYPEPAEPAAAFEELATRAEQARIESVLQDLPEMSRLLLIWRYWEQHSAETMALQTGKTVKAVERSLAKAREQFKAKWREGERDGRS